MTALAYINSNDQIGRGKTYGERLVFMVSATPSSSGSQALANPNYAHSPLLLHKWLDLEHPNSAW